MDSLIETSNKNMYLFTEEIYNYIKKYNCDKNKKQLFCQLLDNKLFFNIEHEEHTINKNEIVKKFNIKNVDRDGNCLFSCLALALNLNISGKQFKKYLYEKYFNSNLMFKKYKKILEGPELWGNIDVIIWFVSIFDLCIYVYLYSFNKKDTVQLYIYGNKNKKNVYLKLENDHYNFLENKETKPYETISVDNKHKLKYVESCLNIFKKEKISVYIFKEILSTKDQLLKTFSNIFNENVKNNFSNLIIYSNKNNINEKDYSKNIYSSNFNYLNIDIIESINLFTNNIRKKKNVKINILSIKKDVHVKDILNQNYNDNTLLNFNKEVLENFVNYDSTDNFNILEYLSIKHDNYYLDNIIIRYKYDNKIFNILYIFQNKDLTTHKKNNLLNHILKNSIEETNVNEFSKKTNIIYHSESLTNILTDINFKFFDQNNKIEENIITKLNFLDEKEENTCYTSRKKIKMDNSLLNNYLEETSINLESYDLNKYFKKDCDAVPEPVVENKTNTHDFVIEDENCKIYEIETEEEEKYKNEIQEKNQDIEKKKNNIESFKNENTIKPSYIYHNNELYILKFNKYYVKASNNFFNINY